MRQMRGFLAAAGMFGALVLTGCGSTGGPTGSGGSTYPPATPLATPTATAVYVVQTASISSGGSFVPQSPDVILGFSALSNGSTGPTSTLTAPIGYTISGVSADSAGNIYAVANQINSINTTGAANLLIYTAGSTGAATPAQTIALPGITAGGFYTAMTLNSAGQIYLTYYVPSGNSYVGGVLVYAASPIAGATPTRVLAGSQSNLQAPFAVAVDATGNIYVSDESLGEIAVFAPGAGDAAASRTITGFDTSDFPELYGLAVDTAGNIYTTVYSSTSGFGQIAEYSVSATASSAPTKVIGGGGLSDDQGIYGIAVDASGNIYGTGAYTSTSQTTGQQVVGLDFFAFAPSATGDVTPANDGIYAQYTNSYFQPIAIH